MSQPHCDSPSYRQLVLEKQLTGFWNKPISTFYYSHKRLYPSTIDKTAVVSCPTTLLQKILLENSFTFCIEKISCWLSHCLHKNLLRRYIETKIETLSQTNLLEIYGLKWFLCRVFVWSNSQNLSANKQFTVVSASLRHAIWANIFLLLPNSFNMRNPRTSALLWFEMTCISDIYYMSIHIN